MLACRRTHKPQGLASNQLEPADHPLLRVLLDHHANPNAESKSVGMSALDAQVIAGDLESVRTILDHGANPNKRLRRTALHWAVIYSRLDIAELLLERGADVNARDPNGMSPLQDAAGLADGDVRVMRPLVGRR